MIAIAGSARVRPDRLDELLGAAAAMAADSRAEPGCEDYRFSIDIDDPSVVRLFELWTDGDALDAHFATPHFARFSEAIGDALEGPPEFTRYEISSAGPLFG